MDDFLKQKFQQQQEMRFFLIYNFINRIWNRVFIISSYTYFWPVI